MGRRRGSERLARGKTDNTWSHSQIAERESGAPATHCNDVRGRRFLYGDNSDPVSFRKRSCILQPHVSDRRRQEEQTKLSQSSSNHLARKTSSPSTSTRARTSMAELVPAPPPHYRRIRQPPS
jgi:hypothetical protein